MYISPSHLGRSISEEEVERMLGPEDGEGFCGMLPAQTWHDYHTQTHSHCGYLHKAKPAKVPAQML